MKEKSLATKMEKPPDEVEFKYIFSEDYNPLYVNGAFGGISSKKELNIHFFLERTSIPNSQIHKIDGNGKLGEEIARNPNFEHPFFVRVVQNGIVLSLESAKRIYQWMGERIDELEKIGDQNVSADKHKK